MGDTVGQRIRRIAHAKGLGDGIELAKKLGVSYETLRKWTGGASAPNRARQKVVSDVLGVPAESFMYGVTEPGQPDFGDTPIVAAPVVDFARALVGVASIVRSLTGMRLTMARAALHELVDHPEMADDAIRQLQRLVADEARASKRSGTHG